MTNVDPAVGESRAVVRSADGWGLQWSPIVGGAFTASAIASIFVTFGATIGLGVSSASPTWRDASFALWLLAGVYLILQALVSFGCGGYFAGRTRSPEAAAAAEDTERRDGLHGIAAWALAVLIGATIAALVGMATKHPTALTPPMTTTEPSVLSYEIDHLLRTPRKLPGAELAPIRAEAGRILLTSSSHSGVSSDDRAYLIQIVTGTTGLAGLEAEHRVDNVIADSRKAVSNARASTIILAFSIATSLLLGAIAAWVAAEAGGRHRDGLPLPGWMAQSNRFNRHHAPRQRPANVT